MEDLKQITICNFCNGEYKDKGWCPHFGLKFRNSFCVDKIVNYREVKVRNDVSRWKFWKSHFTIEKIIIDS